MSTIPQFSSRGEEHGALVISHKEYVQDITGSSLFVNNAFPINPGDPALFPWLCQIACNYDEYEFKGLVFTYRTVTTDLSTTSAQLGTVMMACNYNAGSVPFGTKQELLQYDGAGDVKISHDLMFGIECDPRKNGLGGILYVAPNGTVPAGQDIKTYMLGLFQIATNQCITNGQIGELWVSYKVVLRKPKFGTASGLALPCSALIAQTSTSSGQTIKISGQYNNLEDVIYGGSTPQSVAWCQGSTPVAGYITNVTGSVFNNLTASPQSFPTGFTATQFVGWNIGYTTGGSVQFVYFFPEWLQNGTYQIIISSSQALTGSLSLSDSTGNIIAFAPTGDQETTGNVLAAQVILKQSYQSQTVAGSTTIPNPNKPQLVGFYGTLSSGSTPLLTFTVQQVNPNLTNLLLF